MQVNALKAMVPDLDSDLKKLPRSTIDIRDQFILLQAMDSCARPILLYKAAAIKEYYRDTGSVFNVANGNYKDCVLQELEWNQRSSGGHDFDYPMDKSLVCCGKNHKSPWIG